MSASYTLTDQELSAIERDPDILPERLKTWRREIEAKKADAARTKAFIAEQAAKAGEVW